MTDDIRSKVADAIESAIHDALHPFTPYSTVADAAIAAYQQARRIEAVEQLDALPDRTVVRSREGVIYQRFRDNNLSGLYGEWSTVGYEVPSDSGEVSLPALLLWTPEEQ